MRTLIVEDNLAIGHSLKSGLSDTYVVQLAGTGQGAMVLAEQNDYDLIILDLGLPDISGLEVCTSLRALGIRTPVLVLSAVTELQQKVALLDAGADDYLTKPFSLAELKARMRALLRRDAGEIRNTSLRVADLLLDSDSRVVMRGNREVRLRRKEFDLLEYLMRNSGYVVSRAMVVDNVWGTDTDMWTNAIDVHIKLLRDKIDRPFERKLIKTVHGVGYKIDSGA